MWGEKTLPGLKTEGFADGKLPDVMEGAKAMGYKPEQNLYEALFATPENSKFAWPDPVAKGKANATVKALGENWFVEKALFEEYAPVRPRPPPRPRGVRRVLSATTCAACAGRWSTARRRSTASSRGTTRT